jgi:hypothetical protein
VTALIINPEASAQFSLLETARQQLAQARDMDTVLNIRDQAAAIAHYMKVHAEGMHAQNAAAELKLRAERRLGELLADTVVPRGNHAQGVNGSSSSLPESVSKGQSHRWQQLARIPAATFEQHVSTTLASDKELTTAGALKLASKPVEKEKRLLTESEAKAAFGEYVSNLLERIPEAARKSACACFIAIIQRLEETT